MPIVTAPTPSSRRTAFTLVELLVVITILVILISLTAAGIFRFIQTGTQVTTRTEIGQMELALQTAMTQWKLSSLPSMIKLSPNLNYPQAGTPGTLDAVSLNTLKSMFGRNFGRTIPQNGFNWDPVSNTGQDLILEGEEALVFYLGGIPSKDPTTGVISMTGFSTNPADPTQQTGTRTAPFFDFKSSRLQQSPNFFWYLDPYSTSGTSPKPYAFFSSLSPNNLNGYGNDCPSILAANGQSLEPYFTGINSTTSLPQFINPRGFQIISAGADQQFGPGGQWNPTTGYGGGPGNDDTANFSGSTLGTAQS